MPTDPIERRTGLCVKLAQNYGPLFADLMAGMLAKDQTSRYSLAECIKHPYFQQNTKLVNVLAKFHINHTCKLKQILKKNGIDLQYCDLENEQWMINSLLNKNEKELISQRMGDYDWMETNPFMRSLKILYAY